MDENIVDTLKIEIVADSEKAVNGIDKLISTLEKIKGATSGSNKGLNSIQKNLSKISEAVAKIDSGSVSKLRDLADGLKGLNEVGNIRTGKTANRIVNLGVAVDLLKDVDFSKLTELANGLQALGEVGNVNVPRFDNTSAPTDNVAPSAPAMDEQVFIPPSTVEEMSEGLYEVSKKLSDMTSRFKNIEEIATKAFSKTGAAAVGAGTSIGQVFGKAMKRVHTFFKKLSARVMYRLINAAITAVVSSFKAGVDAVYQYSKTLGGNLAKSLDSIATSFNYLKGSLGAMVAPLLNMLAPAIEWVVDKFVDLLNIVNQVFARLSGATTWTKATKVATEYAQATDEATAANKALKKSILGIDELNVLTDNSSNSSGVGASNTSNFAFEEVPLDFSSVDSVINKLKEILWLVGEIGIGIMAWNATKFILNLSQNIKMLLADAAKLKNIKVAAGVTLSVTGITLSIDAGADIASNGLTINNFLKAIGGIAATAVGGKLIGSAIGAAAGGPIGLAIGLGVGLIATLISVAVNSESDSKKLIDAFYKTEDGKRLSKLKEDVAAACKTTTSLVVQLKDITTEVDENILANYSLGRDFLNEIFSIDAKDIKTDEDIAYLHTLVDIFNSLNLTDASGNSLIIQFDELGENIATSRKELEKLIDTTLQSYKLDAIKEASIKTYKAIIELNETKDDLWARTREAVDTREAAETTIAQLKSRLANMIIDSGGAGINREWVNDFFKNIKWERLIEENGNYLAQVKRSLAGTVDISRDTHDELNDMYRVLDAMVAPYKTAIESQNLVDELFASIKETNNGLDEAYAKLDKYEKDLITGMISLNEAASSSEQAIDSFSSKTIDNTEGITTQITDSTSGVSDKITSCATDASNKITCVSAEIVSKLTDDAEMVVNGAEVQTTGFVKAISAIFNTITNDFRVWSTGTISELQVFLNNAENRVNNFIKNISEKSVTLTLSSKASYEFSGYQAYANGGFPEEGLFFANHSELVGEFSNGKTAVANNEQIISGIKQGVKEAMQETQSSDGDIIIQIVDSAGNVKSQEYVKSSQLTNRRSGKVVIPIGV